MRRIRTRTGCERKIYRGLSPCTKIDKYSYVALLEEIRENDYNLNIPRYVDTFVEEEPVDMDAVKEKIQSIKEELRDVEAQMAKYLEELGL